MKDSENVESTRAGRRASRQPKKIETDAAPLLALAADRIAIEGVSIEIDGGRFPSKVVAGRVFEVEADIFSDGHDTIACAFIYRKTGSDDFVEVPMTFVVNNRWRVAVTLPENALYEASFLAWRDLYATWRKEVAKKHAAGLDIGLELEEGRRLIAAATEGEGLSRSDAKALKDALAADAKLATHAERVAFLGGEEISDADDAGRRPHQPDALQDAAGLRRPEGGGVQRLVRAVPALDVGRSGPARHLRRRDRAAALCARPRLRRALLSADPPDRQDQPQGPQQHA